MRTVKLPAKHATDWLARYDEDDAEGVAWSARTITLSLSDAALRDLISDATYYAEEMDRDNTGDIDYRPAARRCLAALRRQGIGWTRRHFTVTLDDAEEGRS
jgi:hypothetical protein